MVLLLLALIVGILLLRVLRAGNRIESRLTSIYSLGSVDEDYEDDLDLPFAERFLKPLGKKATGTFGNFIPVSDEALKNLEVKLRTAGVRQSAREYVAQGALIVFGAGVVVLLLCLISKAPLTKTLMYCALIIGGVYVLMRFSLSSKITKRSDEIEAGLPDALDLLSTTVTAGLGFDQALQHVIDTCDGPLIDELAITSREIALGVPRSTALTSLAKRCDVDALSTFAGSIAQADRLGMPIAKVLMTQAESVRDARRQRIEEKAAKLPVKILLPIVIFIFPNIFIVLMGPAAMRIMELFAVM